MKISLKDIVVGDICICTEKAEYIDEKDEPQTSYKGKVRQKDVILVKDKFNSYIHFEDLEELGSIALILFGSTIRLKLEPKNLKDKFISNIHPLFQNANNEMYTIQEVIASVNSLTDTCNI